MLEPLNQSHDPNRSPIFFVVVGPLHVDVVLKIGAKALISLTYFLHPLCLVLLLLPNSKKILVLLIMYQNFALIILNQGISGYHKFKENVNECSKDFSLKLFLKIFYGKMIK